MGDDQVHRLPDDGAIVTPVVDRTEWATVAVALNGANDRVRVSDQVSAYQVNSL